MSIIATSRNLAQEHFPSEGRSQGFAFAVGLFYGVTAANNVTIEAGLNPQDAFEQKAKDLYSANISEINSAVVFNVRTALSVFQHTFIGLYTLRTQRFSIRDVGGSVSDVLTNLSEQFTDEEKSIFNQHRDVILKTCLALQEAYAGETTTGV